jgi:hypothetical protein
MILRLLNREIDVENYIDAHPGGRAIITRYTQSGTDASTAFLAAGHSANAMSIVDTLSQQIHHHHVKRSFWQTLKHRLFTHEDYRHLHKLSGLVAILHFGVCFYRFLTSGFRTYGVGVDVVSMLLMANHGVLALLGLQFPVEPLRIKGTQNMTTEQVYHTVIFSMRSLAVYFLSLYIPVFVLVLLHHLAADVTTARYHRSENGTTIRGGTADKWVPQWLLQARNIFAGVAQMGAISALLGAAPPSDAAMMTLIPIQLGAFANTLTKKQLLGSLGHGLLYGGTLAMSYLYFIHTPSMFYIMSLQYLARVVGIHKYLVMTMTAWVIHMMT